ncbi:MAG: alpha/beta fold hydrolase [Longimicrobiaceae bacterium]
MRLRLAAVAIAAFSVTAASAQPAPGLRDGPHDLVVGGVRLFYRVAGRAAAGAPPVVFLHGGPGQGSAHFAALEGPRLERSLRMVYLDQRGSGRSERPWTGEYSLPLLVEDLEGVRRALGVPRIALVGHSFGATLALEYAARYPGRVSKLIVVAGLWDAPGQTRLRCRRTVATFPQVAARALADSTVTAASRESCDWFWNLPEAQREAMNNALMFPDSAVRIRLDSVQAATGTRNTGELGRALFRGGLLQYRFAGMSRLTMPVLVISGRHDGAAVSEGLRELARLLPNARFVEFEKSGHFVYLDEPDRFAREVSAFLGEGG